MVSEPELLAALRHGYHGFIANGHVRAADLPAYARQLKEDLDWIGLDHFQLLPPHTLPVRLGRDEFEIPTVHYRFGETRNSVNYAKPDQTKAEVLTISNTEGPGLDREDLRWVCDVFREARVQLPHLWLKDDRLKTDLASPQKHINTVNELFWLGLWRDFRPEQTCREYSILPGRGKTVDWSLACTSSDAARSRRINLEVKNLSTSMEYTLFHEHLAPDAFVSDALRGLDNKFPTIISEEINLVCFTTFLNVPHKLEELALAVFRNHQSVDAVLFWIAFADHEQNWRVDSRDDDAWQASKSAVIKRHFVRPDYRHTKPLLYSHPLWGVLPWQQ